MPEDTTLPVDEFGRTAAQADRLDTLARHIAARAALTADLVAFVAQVAEREPVTHSLLWDAQLCVWCHSWARDGDIPHTDDCPHTQARRLRERAAALGLTGGGDTQSDMPLSRDPSGLERTER